MIGCRTYAFGVVAQRQSIRLLSVGSRYRNALTPLKQWNLMWTLQLCKESNTPLSDNKRTMFCYIIRIKAFPL